MHNIIAAIKAHPFYLVGGVIAILLLIQLTSKRKAATPSASSAFVVGADPAALAANTQLTLAQDALSAHGQDVAAQLAIAQNSTAANITLAQIGATVQSQQIAASQDVANTSAGDSMAVQTQANMLAANVTQSKNQLSALQTFAANGLDQGLIAQIMSNIQLAAQGLNINKIFMPAYAPAQNAPSYYAPDIQIPNNWASRQDIIHQTADGGS